jgi:hypothetical protein
MDETALLALGILMEEVAVQSLGESGDLVFTEGESRTISKPERSSRGTSRASSAPAPPTGASRKRRRVAIEESN